MSTHYFIMKTLNIRELQQIAFNYSSDIELKDIINLYEKCTAKPYSLVVIDATLASDNPSRSRKNLLEGFWKLFIAIDNKNRDENCNIILTEKQ